MFKGKSLTDYTNLFSPNNFKKNDNLILNFKIVEIKSIECNSIEIKSIEHNSIDISNLNKISEALISNKISHKDFITIINEERNYRELKESIRMMKDEEDKKIDIN